MERENKKLIIDPSEIPLESSLGMLALGDLAFCAWRKVKKESNNHLLIDSEE